MAESMSQVALRPYLPTDLDILVAIYQDSIEELAGEDYSDAQRAAWAEMADEPEFGARLAGALTLVATVGGSAVGFAALKGNEHIDMLYVHPSFARHGVATVLCDALEKLAAARGAKRLTVDASDTARPFFEGRGFRDESRNTVPVGDEWLGNTTMTKMLSAPEGPRS